MTPLAAVFSLAPMKTALLTVFTFAILAMGALASPAETELKTLVQQTMEAYLKTDIDFLERSHAEEFTIVNYDGTTFSKSQELAEFAKKDIVFTALKMSEVKVRMLGENHALLTGVTKGTGKYKGDPFDLTLREVICYEKKGDTWRAIFWQSTEVRSVEDN